MLGPHCVAVVDCKKWFDDKGDEIAQTLLDKYKL